MSTSIPIIKRVQDWLYYIARGSATSGTALVGHMADGAGAQQVKLRDVLLERGVSVTDFGAVGDGVTDDTAAIRLAFASSSRVFFPAGRWRVTSVLTIAGDDVLVHGVGSASVIEYPTNGAASNLRLVFTGDNVTVRDLKFSEVNSPTRTGLYGCLSFNGATNVLVENVEVDGASSTGIHVMDSHYGRITGCYIHNTCADGIHIQRGSSEWEITGNTVRDTGDDCIGVSSHGWPTADYVQSIAVTGNVVGSHNNLNAGSRGINFAGVIGGTISDNVVHDTNACGIGVTSITEGGRTAVSGRINIGKNTIYNTGADATSTNPQGISLANCRNVTVQANNVMKTRTQGLILSGSVVDILVENNLFCYTGSTGVYTSFTSQTGDFLNLWDDALLTDGSSAASVYAHNIVIRNNLFDRIGTDGMLIQGAVGTLIDKLNIGGNVITRSNTTNTASTYGIRVTYADKVEVTGNTVKDPANAITSFSLSSCTNDLLSSDNWPSSSAMVAYTGGALHAVGAAAPGSGTYAVGDIVWNTAPASAGYVGWVCTVAGTPGTWKGFGTIA